MASSFVLRFNRPIDSWYYGTFAREKGTERRLGGRMALISKIEINGKDVHVVSVHLECMIGDHAVEASQLCDKLDSIGARRVVLGGDTCGDEPFFRGLRSCGFMTREEANMMGPQGHTYRTEHCHDGISDGLSTRGDWMAVRGMSVVPGSMRTFVPGNGECLSDHALISLDLQV